MKFIPGPLAGSLSGKLGASVASHNRGGSYFRRRTKPVVSTTSWAEGVKSAFATVSAAWAGLTDDQREAFTLYGANHPVVDRIGQKVTLDGHGVFVQLNALQTDAGGSILTLPPVEAPPDGLTSLSLDGAVVSSELNITFTPTQATTSAMIMVQAAITESAGRNYVKGRLKLCGFSAEEVVSQVNILTLVQDRLGSIQNGQTLHVQASTYNKHTGLRSLPLSTKATLSGL